MMEVFAAYGRRVKRALPLAPLDVMQHVVTSFWNDGASLGDEWSVRDEKTKKKLQG